MTDKLLRWVIAFQTAVALAEYRFLTKLDIEEEGETAVLGEEDFKQICNIAMKFKEYLMDMNDGLDKQGRAAVERGLA